MNCLICTSPARELFVKIVRGKHRAHYHQCEACGFVSVSPHEEWLDEAYSSAITKSDLGLLARNLHYSGIVERLIFRHFDPQKVFLDYAGGYGVFTRMMRDRGFNFHYEDGYCENLFATNFDASKNNIDQYELVTAFEFMEHVPNPLKAVRQILERTESFLFSTEIIPEQGMEGWPYLATETGQHISFYTVKSLQALANHFGLQFYTNGYSLHLLTKKSLPANALSRKKSLWEKLRKRKRKSLLQVDYDMVRGQFAE
jgi:hypothetical protein